MDDRVEESFLDLVEQLWAIDPLAYPLTGLSVFTDGSGAEPDAAMYVYYSPGTVFEDDIAEYILDNAAGLDIQVYSCVD